MIDKPKYVTDIKTTPFIFPDSIIPSGNGANFDKLPVQIVVIFSQGIVNVDISHIEFTDKNSNIKSFNVILYGESDKILQQIKKDSITDIIPVNKNLVIKKIEIDITSTTNGKAPSSVKLSIKGCEHQTTIHTTTPHLTSTMQSSTSRIPSTTVPTTISSMKSTTTFITQSISQASSTKTSSKPLMSTTAHSTSSIGSTMSRLSTPTVITTIPSTSTPFTTKITASTTSMITTKMTTSPSYYYFI